jgi:hypothetical protein
MFKLFNLTIRGNPEMATRCLIFIAMFVVCCTETSLQLLFGNGVGWMFQMILGLSFKSAAKAIGSGVPVGSIFFLLSTAILTSTKPYSDEPLMAWRSTALKVAAVYTLTDLYSRTKSPNILPFRRRVQRFVITTLPLMLGDIGTSAAVTFLLSAREELFMHETQALVTLFRAWLILWVTMWLAMFVLSNYAKISVLVVSSASVSVATTLYIAREVFAQGWDCDVHCGGLVQDNLVWMAMSFVAHAGTFAFLAQCNAKTLQNVARVELLLAWFFGTVGSWCGGGYIADYSDPVQTFSRLVTITSYLRVIICASCAAYDARALKYA